MEQTAEGHVNNMRHPIVVVGSINTDLVAMTQRVPCAGETVRGEAFHRYRGGKGANQAVAIARLGWPVALVGKVGEDAFAAEHMNALAQEGVDTRFVKQEQGMSTGAALITLEKSGENRIIIVAGANGQVGPAEIDDAHQVICRAPFLVVQLELPVETVEYAIATAHACGVPVVLNPAPAAVCRRLDQVSVITPNAVEAETITGMAVTTPKQAWQAAGMLHESGVETVVITLGKQGAAISHGGHQFLIPAYPVQVIDTVGAGDAFTAALTVGLAQGWTLLQAGRFAAAAAAIAVSRSGAQASLAFRSEVDAFLC